MSVTSTTRWVAFWGVFLLGCGQVADDANSNISDEPCTVEQQSLTGEYLLDVQEVEGGDCGGMGDLPVHLNEGVIQPDARVGCAQESDFWEQEVCTNRTTFVCDDGEWKMRLEWTVVGDADSQGGIRGELYAEMDRWNGIYTCSSTYVFVGDWTGGPPGRGEVRRVPQRTPDLVE